MTQDPKMQTRRAPDPTDLDPVTWRVVWEIDIEAVSAQEAALRALHIMRNADPANTAVVFGCTAPSGHAEVVDLLALAEEA